MSTTPQMEVEDFQLIGDAERQLAEAILEAQQLSHQLAEQLRWDRLPALEAGRCGNRDEPRLWLEDQEEQRERLCSGFTDFEIGDDANSAKSARRYNGVMMASPAAFYLAVLVNEARTRVKVAKRVLDGFPSADWRNLTLLGRHRLQYHQLTRTIQYFGHRPYRVNFTWQNHWKSIKRLTAPKALELIDQLGDDDGTRFAKAQLNNYQGDIARVAKEPPFVMVQLSFHEGERTTPKGKVVPGIVRQKVHASAPILIPFVKIPPKVTFRQGNRDNENRLPRSDRKIVDADKSPAISPIRGYLYRPTPSP